MFILIPIGLGLVYKEFDKGVAQFRITTVLAAFMG